MKKNNVKEWDKKIVVIPIVFLVIVFVTLFWLLKSSLNLKECRQTMISFTSGEYSIISTHGNTHVKFNNDNLDQLQYFFYYTDMQAPVDDTEYEDSIFLKLSGDSDWTMNIYKIDEETLKYEIDGNKHYEFCSPDKGYFSDYIKLFSEAGWTSPNRLVQ